MTLAHTILAMVGTKIARVKCNTCGGDHVYRGTNTGDARASGSGLGLAIARSIVEMHGGEIDVASVLGQGTIFRIRLPRLAATAEHEADTKVNETSRAAHTARNPGPIA